MDIRIEYGDYSDLDHIARLYDDVNDTLESSINYPGWKKGIYPVRSDALAGIEDHSLFVARKDHKIVGSIILNHQCEKAYASAKWQYNGDYCSVLVVHTLAVHPDCSHSGIGVQLLKFAEKFAIENNVKAIRLDVYEKNVPAIQLYERCGYRYIATVDLGLACHGLEWFKLYEKLL